MKIRIIKKPSQNTTSGRMKSSIERKMFVLLAQRQANEEMGRNEEFVCV